MSMMPGHHGDCECFGCEWARRERRPSVIRRAPLNVDTPIQEADGHFRGCARLGKCHCPANAPRDPFFCEHSERPEACWPCAKKEKKP